MSNCLFFVGNNLFNHSSSVQRLFWRCLDVCNVFFNTLYFKLIALHYNIIYLITTFKIDYIKLRYTALLFRYSVLTRNEI